MQIHDAIIGNLNYNPMMVTLMDTMVHFEYMKDIKHTPCLNLMIHPYGHIKLGYGHDLAPLVIQKDHGQLLVKSALHSLAFWFLLS